MIIETKILKIYTANKIGFFRLFGWGICWKDINEHGLLFSERNGFRKYLKIGNWVFKILL